MIFLSTRPFNLCITLRGDYSDGKWIIHVGSVGKTGGFDIKLLIDRDCSGVLIVAVWMQDKLLDLLGWGKRWEKYTRSYN